MIRDAAAVQPTGEEGEGGGDEVGGKIGRCPERTHVRALCSLTPSIWPKSCQNFLLSWWARSCLCRKELSALNGDKEALADLVQRAAAPSHLATKREQNRGG